MKSESSEATGTLSHPWRLAMTRLSFLFLGSFFAFFLALIKQVHHSEVTGYLTRTYVLLPPAAMITWPMIPASIIAGKKSRRWSNIAG
jgi:EamA domain-containing membrane protein RarD